MRDWQPLRPVERGQIQPCGENPDGSHLEFFAHPDDVPAMLRDGVILTGPVYGRRRFHVSLSPTPRYANGDIQIVLKEAA